MFQYRRGSSQGSQLSFIRGNNHQPPRLLANPGIQSTGNSFSYTWCIVIVVIGGLSAIAVFTAVSVLAAVLGSAGKIKMAKIF